MANKPSLCRSAKSYHSKGSCHIHPGCKYGYNNYDCGSCDSQLGYGRDEDGNCNNCIDRFFVKRNYTDGRPECQGIYMDIYYFRKTYIKY